MASLEALGEERPEEDIESEYDVRLTSAAPVKRLAIESPAIQPRHRNRRWRGQLASICIAMSTRSTRSSAATSSSATHRASSVVPAVSWRSSPPTTRAR